MGDEHRSSSRRWPVGRGDREDVEVLAGGLRADAAAVLDRLGELMGSTVTQRRSAVAMFAAGAALSVRSTGAADPSALSSAAPAAPAEVLPVGTAPVAPDAPSSPTTPPARDAPPSPTPRGPQAGSGGGAPSDDDQALALGTLERVRAACRSTRAPAPAPAATIWTSAIDTMLTGLTGQR